MFSNYNYLTKMISDNITEMNTDNNRENNKITNLSTNNSTPALTQGNKYKKYQKKIKKHLEENANELSGKEGFEGLNLNDFNLTADGLTQQSNTIITKNDSSSSQNSTDSLRQMYQDTLKEYEKLVAQIQGTTSGYLDRVSSNNPYLGKNIQFTTGETAYVSQQGIVKIYPKNANGFPDILLGTAGKNGCPSGQYIIISLPWLPKYNVPGVTIPSKPPLVTGTPVEKGQSCGNEGKNVFVNTLVIKPESSYVGCYNNIPQSTEIMFVPVMGPSNSANGFTSFASSTYQNNNTFTGPWNAFDNNVNTWWHCNTDGPNTMYDSNTGVYTGANGVTFNGALGQGKKVKGEFLLITSPKLIPLTKYSIQGRQGCCGIPNGRDPNTWYILGDNNGVWTQVDYQSNVSFNFQMKTFNIQNPQPYSSYLILITVAGDAKAPAGSRNCVQIATWNLYTSSNYINNPKPAMTNAGKMSYDQCQSYALNTGNKYFGIQDVDSNGIGNCMISNDLAGTQIYGNGLTFTAVSVWSSKTNSGSMATLTNTGSLSVFNSGGQAIFNTPNLLALPSNYLGCYGDGPDRAMPLYNNGAQQYNLQQCQQIAQQNGMNYFGLQNSTSGTTAQCALSNDLGQTMKYGAARNCSKIADGSWSGGGYSNAVYNAKEPISNYVLIVGDYYIQIQRGTNPDDFQGDKQIWGMNFTKNVANPNFAAEKGKYGKNWISQGSTLAPGDFVGSPSGYAYLIMQTDGNLVLYTNSQTSSCSASKSANGKTVGNSTTNALYQLENMGLKSNMGKVAYVDENSKIHAYPSNNIQYNTTYTTIKGIDNPGNDIAGAAFGNATVESCETACNNNNKCAGFVYANNTNVCYPKDSNMYPSGSIQMNSNTDLYTKNKNPITPPIGVPLTANNTDTNTFQNYIDGGSLDNSYGLANATSVQKKQLSQLQIKMNLLSKQISGLTTRFETGTNTAETQSKKNVKGIGNYLTNLNQNNTKIANFPSSNIDNILGDSDIVVLQKNYDYLFWSILAAGTVLVTMNVVKKQ
jgi:hypothetical protein